MQIRVGDRIEFCTCPDGTIRTIRLSRDKLAYVIHCTCGKIYYVSITGKRE